MPKGERCLIMATSGNSDVLLQTQLSCSPRNSGLNASAEDNAQSSQAGNVMQQPFLCSPMGSSSRATLGCPRELRRKHAQDHFSMAGDPVTLLGRVGKHGSSKDQARTPTTSSRSKSPVAYLTPIQEEDDFSPPSDSAARDHETQTGRPQSMAFGSKGSESLRECTHTPRRKGVSREDTKDYECQESTAAGTQSPTTSELPFEESLQHSWLVRGLLHRMTVGQVNELVLSITRPELATSSIHNPSSAKCQLASGAVARESRMRNQCCGVRSPRGTAEPQLGSGALTPERRRRSPNCGISSPRGTEEFQLDSGVLTPERSRQNQSCVIRSPRGTADLQLDSGAATPERKMQNPRCSIRSPRSAGTQPRPCWK